MQKFLLALLILGVAPFLCAPETYIPTQTLMMPEASAVVRENCAGAEAPCYPGDSGVQDAVDALEASNPTGYRVINVYPVNDGTGYVGDVECCGPGADVSGTPTAYADGGGGFVEVTSAAHTLANGNEVVIVGTTNYNGTFRVSSVAANTFEIEDTWVANDCPANCGTWTADCTGNGTGWTLIRGLGNRKTITADSTIPQIIGVADAADEPTMKVANCGLRDLTLRSSTDLGEIVFDTGTGDIGSVTLDGVGITGTEDIALLNAGEVLARIRHTAGVFWADGIRMYSFCLNCNSSSADLVIDSGGHTSDGVMVIENSQFHIDDLAAGATTNTDVIRLDSVVAGSAIRTTRVGCGPDITCIQAEDENVGNTATDNIFALSDIDMAGTGLMGQFFNLADSDADDALTSMISFSGFAGIGNTQWGVENNLAANSVDAAFGLNLIGWPYGRSFQMVEYNDFLGASSLDTTNDWTVTAIKNGGGGAGTVALADDSALGLTVLTPEAAANTGSQFQRTAGAAGEFVLPAVGRLIEFEARVAVADVDEQDWVIGLAETQAVAGTSGVIDETGAWVDADAVVFNCNDADNGIIEAAYEDPTVGNLIDVGDVNTGAAFTDGTYHIYKIRIIGRDELEWYIDGIRQQTVTAANPLTNNLAIVFANVGDGAGETMTVDYYRVTQTR